MEYNVLPIYLPLSSSTKLFLWAFVTAIGFFISILIHEAGHIITERSIGLPIRNRILFPYGGIVKDTTPADYDALISVSLSGPLASIITATLWHVLYLIASHNNWPTPVMVISQNLTNINIIITGINILPLPPFDGGVILKSLLNCHTFKRIPELSTSINTVILVFTITFSLLLIFKGVLLSGIWFLFGVMFFREGLQYCNPSTHLKQILKETNVGDFLRENPVTVQADTVLPEFINHYMYRYHTGIFPVVRNQQILGFILTSSIKKISQKYWNSYLVSDLTMPYSSNLIITKSTNLLKTITVMCKYSTGRLLSIDFGEISGVVTLKDLLHYFALRIDTKK